MERLYLVFILLTTTFIANAIDFVSEIEPNKSEIVITENALFCEDSQEKYSVNDLINDSLNNILIPKTKIKDIDYKYSIYW